MRKLFVTLLAVGLLSIMGGQAQNRNSRHQLDLTTGVSCHFQSGGILDFFFSCSRHELCLYFLCTSTLGDLLFHEFSSSHQRRKWE